MIESAFGCFEDWGLNTKCSLPWWFVLLFLHFLIYLKCWILLRKEFSTLHHSKLVALKLPLWVKRISTNKVSHIKMTHRTRVFPLKIVVFCQLSRIIKHRTRHDMVTADSPLLGLGIQDALSDLKLQNWFFNAKSVTSLVIWLTGRDITKDWRHHQFTKHCLHCKPLILILRIGFLIQVNLPTRVIMLPYSQL